MNLKNIILPFYTKAGIFFVGFCALIAILYIAQSIFIPLIFSFIIAILLHPVVNFFIRFRINRVVAIIITLLLSVVIILAFSIFLYNQVLSFSESWPVFVDKFSDLLNQTIKSASHYFDIRQSSIHAWITKTQHELINIDGTLIGQTLVNVGGVMAALVLVPVYIFVILYYQPLLIEFIHRLFDDKHQNKVKAIVAQTKSVIQHYLVGLAIEFFIVGALNSIGLLLLGIEYAILLGVLGALLNFIPYLGGIISVGLFMMVALVTKSSAWFILYVFGVHMFIQVIDNNFIVPKIVASKVKINALFSIIVVLVGNLLWGIPGMFLSIPMLAIIKLIFDHIDSLKPWGFLLGDTMPAVMKFKKKLVVNSLQQCS